MCALAAAAGAQPDATGVRPETAGRFVRIFDFEEAHSSSDEVPRLWYRAQDDPTGLRRLGFPNWNRARLEFSADGGAVELPTRGGSTSLLLAKGAVPVFPDADYRVLARTRLQGLNRARGVLVARFLDRAGAPIPGGEARAVGPASPDWQPVQLDVLGKFPDAAWLQLELQLLQPDELAKLGGGRIDPESLPLNDFSGSAWFDDVKVMQLPRVEITTASTCNIVVMPEKPTLKLLARDLAGEQLQLAVEVVDVDGRVVDVLNQPLDQRQSEVRWSPQVPALGWYRAQMTLRAGGLVVGDARVDFIWAPEAGQRSAASDQWRFGLVADHLADSMAPLLPELARRSQAGAMTIPVWDSALTPEHVADRAKLLSPVVSALLQDWREVTLNLPVVPETLAGAARVRADDPWGALRAERSTWMPYAEELFDVLGQRAGRWQLGPTGDDKAYWSTQLGEELKAGHASLSRLVPGPTVVVPTRIDRAWSSADLAQAPAVLASVMPPELTPYSAWLAGDQARTLAAPGGQDSGASTTAVFTLAPEGQHEPGRAASHLARCAIEFWAASTPEKSEPVTALGLFEPWTWDAQRRPRLSPSPELAAWRTLAVHLCDRRNAGEFAAGPGVKCYILAPGPRSNAGGALVAWTEGASTAGSVLEAYLGAGPIRVVDLYGNERPADSSPTQPTAVRVALSESPVFIEGVDVNLVRCLAGIIIDPAGLESGGEQQDRAIVISNPWPVVLTGRVSILEPGGFGTGQRDRAWRISPRTLRFQIPPGRTDRLPFSVGFSAGEEAGVKPFVMELDLQADTRHGPVTIQRDVEVSLQGLRLDVTCTVRPAGDVVVEAAVSNDGREARTLNVTVFAPGEPRRKGVIGEVKPGRQATQRFVFPGAGAAMRGQRVLVSIEDPETNSRTTRSATVP